MRRIYALTLLLLPATIHAIFPGTEILIVRDNTYTLEIMDGDSSNSTTVKAVTIKTYNGRNLSTDICDTYPNLENYNANHLMVEGIDENSFVACDQLKIVRLSNNNLRKLEPNTFNRNLDLEIIEMYDNEIDELHHDLFKGLVNLKELYLSNNNLVYLPPEIFRDTKNLFKLTLNSNPLLDLDVENLIEYLPLLKAVNIEDTDIKCGKMRTIVHLFSERKIIFYIGVDRERGRTFTPAEFRGHKCLSNEQYDRELLLRQNIPETIQKVNEMYQQMMELMKNVTKLMSLVKK